MIFPMRSLFDPCLYRVYLRRLQRFGEILGGHTFLGVWVSDPKKQFTRSGFSSRNQDVFTFPEQTVLEVQP